MLGEVNCLLVVFFIGREVIVYLMDWLVYLKSIGKLENVGRRFGKINIYYRSIDWCKRVDWRFEFYIVRNERNFIMINEWLI